MKWLNLLLLLPAVMLAEPARAQVADSTSSGAIGAIGRSGIEEALDSVAREAGPALAAAAEELSVTVADIATRIANDARLRSAFVEAAQGMLTLGRLIVAENAETLEKLLGEASAALGEISQPRERTPAAPLPDAGLVEADPG